MAEMFGTPGGFRAYDEDQARLALLASQTRHQDALTRMNDAQAGQMTAKARAEEEDRAVSRQIAEKLRREAAGPSGPLNPSEIPTADAQMSGLASGGPQAQLALLYREAELLREAGRLDAADKKLKMAGDIAKDLETAAAQRHLGTRRQAQTRIELGKHIADMFAGVRTPQQFHDAMMQWRTDPMLSQLEPPDDLKRGYNPAAVARLVASSQRAIELYNAEIRDREQALREEWQPVRIAESRARANALLRNAATREAAEARRAGAGGNPKGATAADREYAKEVLRAQGYSLASESMVSFEVADLAASLAAANPGHNMTSATAQAIAELRASGRLPEPGKDDRGWLDKLMQKPRKDAPDVSVPPPGRPSKGGAAPPAKPAAGVPLTRQQLSDPKFRPEAGKTYTIEGKQFRYDPAKGFVKVSAAAAPQQLAMANILGDDDEDEDNG